MEGESVDAIPYLVVQKIVNSPVPLDLPLPLKLIGHHLDPAIMP